MDYSNVIDTLDYDFEEEGEEPMKNVTPPPAESVASAPEDAPPPEEPAPEAKPEPAKRMPLPAVTKKRKPWEKEPPRPNRPRLPPHSIEMEEQLLGACMLDGEDVMRRCATNGIKPASFYVPANRIIFEKMERLYAQKLPIDLYVLGEELKATDQLDEVGGYGYLTRLDSKVPTTAKVAYCVDKLRELARLRDIATAATLAIERCYGYTGPEDMPEILAPLGIAFEETGSLTDELAACRIDYVVRPKSAKVIFRMAGKTVSTQGNLTAIIAQAKAGKTTLVGGLVSAIIAADGLSSQKADTLGWESVPTEGAMVLYFDTEQSPDDSWKAFDRGVRRAHGPKDMPDNYVHYCMTGKTAVKVKALVRAAIESMVRQKKAIHCVILDGVADLCGDVNDNRESNDLVAELHGLAIYGVCPIICVMHRNEGEKADTSARGHLGKQLARKAETNLRLEQKEGVSYVFADRNRGAPIKEDEGPAFKWLDQSMMHVSISDEEKAMFHRDNEAGAKKGKPKRAEKKVDADEPPRTKEERKRWSESEVLDLFPFSASKAMPLAQLARRAESELMMSARVFSEYRHNLLFEGKIFKNSEGLYYRDLT